MEGMDPVQRVRHLGMMARRAMQLRDYHDAIELLSMGLSQLQSLNCPPHFAAPFLLDRAECFWQLGDVHVSLQEMDNSLRLGLPRDDYFAEVTLSNKKYNLVILNKSSLTMICWIVWSIWPLNIDTSFSSVINRNYFLSRA